MSKLYAFIIICLLSTSYLYPDEQESLMMLEQYKQNIQTLDKKIKNNIWINKYKNYTAYKKIKNELSIIDKKIKRLLRLRTTAKRREQIEELKRLQANKQTEVKLLSEHKKSIFGELGKSPEIGELPQVTNPISAISALSYIKQLSQQESDLKNINQSLKYSIDIISEQAELIERIEELDINKTVNGIYKNKLNETYQELSDFNIALEHLTTTSNVFTLKVQEVKLKLKSGIKNQYLKLLNIVIFIGILIVIGFIIKFLIKKYTYNNIKITEKSYLINKAINISMVILTILILFFSYIDNVTYLVTVLGFASAGIAIAMKDWFMSILGWFAMVLGGSIHVGDRIKIIRLGQEIIGDVLDISLLKITLHEDVTLDTYTTTRRAGRIVFIPNNYIFTQAIFNYSHAGLKTVWDGIDFTITFDSNHEKTKLIATQIATKYSQGYTEITRKQLNKLRRLYGLRNTHVEPRVFIFMEPNGIKISVWYQANAFADLSLRSTISTEILDTILKEDDIQIANSNQMLPQEKPKINKIKPIIQSMGLE